MVEELGEESLESPEKVARRPERVVSRSFRQGFGFGLGIFFGLIIAVLVLSLLVYIALLSGIINWDELPLP